MSSRFDDEDWAPTPIDDREFKSVATLERKADNCGTGAGGFQEGNDCAVGHGRPPSDRRQGPVSQEEKDKFEKFVQDLAANTRSDAERVTADPDGNSFDRRVKETTDIMGDRRVSVESGIQMAKDIPSDVSVEEARDLHAWSRNPQTVVDKLRDGESVLERKGRETQELEEALGWEWEEDALKKIEGAEEADARDMLKNQIRRLVAASYGIKSRLTDANNVNQVQLPRGEGDEPPLRQSDFDKSYQAANEYYDSLEELGRMYGDQDDHSVRDFTDKIRQLRDTFQESHAPLKEFFSKAKTLEQDYISRLESNVGRSIRTDGEPVTVFRGMRVRSPEAKRLYDEILKGDDRFEFTSVNSTSLSSDVAENFAKVESRSSTPMPSIMFEITARKGQLIGEHSMHDREAEVLLPARSNARIVDRELIFHEGTKAPLLYVKMEMEDE